MGCIQSVKPLEPEARGDRDSSGGPKLVLRIVGAELYRSFDDNCLMDPFTIVEWIRQDTTKFQCARTHTHYGGDKNPTWNHVCPGQPLRPGDRVQFRIEEENGDEASTFCGEGQIGIEDLVKGCPETKPADLASLPNKVVPLTNNGETIGKITVQAMYEDEKAEQFTQADASKFEMPVKRIGVSGGTAPFFKLVQKDGGAGYWIGKDLSHALDEVDFYEGICKIRMAGPATKNLGGIVPLLPFMFEYAGVVKAPEAGKEDEPPRELLVMRNLFDGCKKLRMLDIKIGERTACAGWQGKSRMRALKQSLLDGMTNSVQEGFRAEGFDGEPATLTSMDPLMDVGGSEGKNPKTVKKARRIMLQRMPGAEMLRHLLDVHQIPSDGEDSMVPAEYGEAVLWEVVRKMVGLSIACRQVDVPQKWLGSSVALGFDAGILPSRSESREKLREKAKVYVFDWGRSELNSQEHHKQLSDADQADRQEYWKLYCNSIERLAWETMRCYLHRFGNAEEWDEIEIICYDFDSMTDNDFLGRVVLPLQTTEPTSVQLMNNKNQPVRNAKLMVSIAPFRELPASSNLKGVWQICVHSGEGLPNSPACPDPFVSINAKSKGGGPNLKLKQITCVLQDTREPSWNETFELPIMRKDSISLAGALNEAFPGLGAADLRSMAPPEDAEDAEELKALSAWTKHVDAVMAKGGPSGVV
jgi:hypothetical protein